LTNVDLNARIEGEEVSSGERGRGEGESEKTDVVEEDRISHGPQLETNSCNLVEICGFFIFEVIRVTVSSMVDISSIGLS